jgi:hypothetical protein
MIRRPSTHGGGVHERFDKRRTLRREGVGLEPAKADERWLCPIKAARFEVPVRFQLRVFAVALASPPIPITVLSEAEQHIRFATPQPPPMW